MEIKKLNKFILLVCLSFYSLNIYAAKTDEVTILPHIEKPLSKKEQIKKWISEHKLITAIATTLVIAGIGTGAYFLHKKLSDESYDTEKIDMDIITDTTKSDLDRLNAVKKIYEHRIYKIESGLNKFNAASSFDIPQKKKDILDNLYQYLPEPSKNDLAEDLKKNNPTMTFNESKDYAKMLTENRILELLEEYKDKYKTYLDYTKDSIQAINNVEVLKTTKPTDYKLYYDTPEKTKEVIKKDLKRAKDNFERMDNK